jgi:hypothetical protein
MKQNFVEAAVTLMQESKMMGWQQNIIDQDSEFELNEQIHLTCIRLLDLGKCWERAVELCKVLESKYEHDLLDFKKLGEILKIRVSFHEKIFQQRSYPSYFRVAFYGLGFGESLNGRQFIYRGEDWEKLDSFIKRFEEEYNPVQIDYSKATIDVSKSNIVNNPECRIVQINPVDPVVDIRNWSVDGRVVESNSGVLGIFNWTIERQKPLLFKNSPLWIFSPELFWDAPAYQIALKIKEKLPQEINDYYEKNELSMFCLSRPFVDPESQDTEASFHNLWTEKTVFFVENCLPYLARRSRIVQIMTFKTSPIENAIIAIRQKTKELIKLLSKYRDLEPSRTQSIDWDIQRSEISLDTLNSRSSRSSLNVNPFTMALSGAVDAPVNGGIQNYKSAFLENQKYINDSNLNLRETLKRVIVEQVFPIN